MKQGEQAWLLAGAEGNHEFARVFFIAPKGEDAPRYILKDGKARIGPSELVHVEVAADGATLTWSCGRKSLIPKDWYQLTWRA